MGDGDNGGDDPGLGEGDPGLGEGGNGLQGLVVAVVLFGLASLFLGLLIAPGGPGNQAWRDAQEVQEVRTNRARARTLIVTAIYAFALAIFLCWAQPSTPLAAEGAADDLSDAEALCTNCFNVLPPGVVFCPYCGAHASVLATHGGIEYVYAQAWCLGRAAHGPNRPLQVVGMAVIVAPYALPFSHWALGAGLLTRTRELLLSGGLGTGLGLAVALGLFWLLLYGFILVRCAANLDSDDPDQLDPARGPYGSPPWWSFDTRQVPPESHEPVG